MFGFGSTPALELSSKSEKTPLPLREPNVSANLG